jgi:hypothetical protein
MRTLSILLLYFLIASCTKKHEDDATSNNPGATTMSMAGMLDDTSFTADYFSSAYPGPLLHLYGYDTHSLRSITLDINNKDVGTHQMTLDLNGTSASCAGGGGIGYYSFHGAGHGSITVSASSSTEVSGTFSFTGYNLSGTDSALVSGQFEHFTF